MDERAIKTVSSRNSGEAQQTNEVARRAEFIAKFSPQIEKLIKDKFPDKNYPAVVVPRIAHYLYGAWLVNQIADKFLFERYFGVNILKLVKRPQLDENDNYTGGGQLNSDDLADWPILWRDTNPVSKDIRAIGLKGPEDAPYQSGITGEFAVPIGYFAEIDHPEAKVELTLRKSKGILDKGVRIKDTTIFEQDIYAGIHEATHALRDFARKKEVRFAEHPDLAEVKDVKIRHRIIKTEGAVSYLAEIGEEFGNFLLWSEIIKNNLPDIWGKGYGNLYTEVIKWRKNKLNSAGKVEESPLTLTDFLESFRHAVESGHQILTK